MDRFDYHTEQTILSDKDLNKLGKDGWELVSHTAVIYAGELRQYYIFKRKL